MPDTGGLTDIVNAPADKIIEALTDFDAYPQWQSSVIECTVKERDADGRGTVVEMYVDAKIRKLRYTVRYSYDLPGAMQWDYVSGDMKDNAGTYKFVPQADGSTEVTNSVVIETGFFVPGPMKTLIRDQSLKNSMRELKKRVEN